MTKNPLFKITLIFTLLTLVALFKVGSTQLALPKKTIYFTVKHASDANHPTSFKFPSQLELIRKNTYHPNPFSFITYYTFKIQATLFPNTNHYYFQKNPILVGQIINLQTQQDSLSGTITNITTKPPSKPAKTSLILKNNSKLTRHLTVSHPPSSPFIHPEMPIITAAPVNLITSNGSNYLEEFLIANQY